MRQPAADRSLLEALHPDKLLPSTDEVPERFEFGTLPYELMAGTTAAVDFIAGLADVGVPNAGATQGVPSTTRRERILASYAALHEHEARLLARLEGELRELPGMRVYSNAERRTPTLLFTIDGHVSTEVYRALAERGVNAPASNFYALECSWHLGLGDEGGVRVGLAPYTNDEDVDRLIDGLREIVTG